MKRLLSKVGLDEKEVLVYEDCLNNEPTNPAEIVRRTGLKRSTVYFYLDRLKEKGLVEQRIVSRRKQVITTPPGEAFETLIANKKDELAEAEDAAGKLIPELLKQIHQKNADDGSIQYFIGLDSAKYVLEKVFESEEDLYWLGSMEFFFNFIPPEKFFRQVTVERMSQGTTSYAITDRRILEYPEFRSALNDFKQFRYLEKPFRQDAFLFVFGSNLCIASKEGRDLRLALLPDESVAKIVLFMFKTLWNVLPEAKTDHRPLG